MKIFSIALNSHDHNTYDGIYHMQSERITRQKHNIPWHANAYPSYSDAQKQNLDDGGAVQAFYDEYYKDYDDILAFTLTRHGISFLESHDIPPIFLNFKPQFLWDYCKYKNEYYIDHHQSHAAYAYLSSGYKESDILAIDGNGSNFKCIFIDSTGKIHDLSKELPIGLLWNSIAKDAKFGHLGAGKLMGLSAYGNVDEMIYFILESKWELDIEKYDIKDVAATLQQLTMDKVFQYVLPLKSSDNLCVAGGVAYNGYMNEEFTKHWTNVHIPPAVGDEGQSLGTYMHANYTLNKNIHVPNTYAGKEYGFDGGEPITPREVGEAIANGKIVGWFNGKSESGNRALGNRSILADPRNPEIKNIINETIKMREDFRPFAPAVMEQHYQTYFDTNQPSPYMSRIMPVKSNKIPGVTHVDGTARIQTVNRKQNEKFYDVIKGFYQMTGIPMVLNTSFNCREPMVETPEQALKTFNRTELDMVVINGRCVSKMG